MDYYIDVDKEVLIVGKPTFKYRIVSINGNLIWIKKSATTK